MDRNYRRVVNSNPWEVEVKGKERRCGFEEKRIIRTKKKKIMDRNDSNVLVS